VTPSEFIKKAQVNWGAFEGDPDEVFGIWRGALANVRPEQLQAAFDYLVKSSKFKPKPADVFTAIEKLGMTAAKPKEGGGLKYGAMLDYAATRRWEMMDDWRRANHTLWQEAERDQWDGIWTVEARNRAHDLAQVEYIAKNHGWPKQAVTKFEVTQDEIAGDAEFRLHYTAAQIALMRKMGEAVGKKPARVYGFKSAGAAAPDFGDDL